MKPRHFKFLSIVFFLFFGLYTSAQITQGGVPNFFSLTDPAVLHDVPEQTLPAINPQQLRSEESDVYYERVAIPLNRQFTETDGAWVSLDDEKQVWYFRVTVPQASGLLLTFEEFSLPAGARLFLMSPQGKQTLGAYTDRNNKTGGLFTAGFIYGEDLILEYDPGSSTQDVPFRISNVYAAYKDVQISQRNTGFGESLDCHININCDLGSNWQVAKRGVTRIMMVLEEGVGYCSGSLINNTAQDETPYILSAFHCQDGYTPLYGNWRFDFNYEADSCQDPANEPAFQSIVGCQQRAGRQESDFLLLELLSPVPGSYRPYFNGWSRFTFNPPSKGTLIHHPIGDIKKISHDTTWAIIRPTSISWNTGVVTPPEHHFRLELDYGTSELGSSGSPHFNQDMHIVGQLHGGNADCGRFTAYCGRFALSWDEGGTPETQLKDWLDPLDLDVETLDGYDPPIDTTQVALSGTICTPDGQGVSGVEVSLSPANAPALVTGPNGEFLFSELPRDVPYSITASKLSVPSNGVSTIDIVKVRQHLLNLDPFTENYQMLAADTDGNDSVSTVDIIHIRKLILNLATEFPNGVPSWKFDPAILEMGTVTSDQNNLKMEGIKTGDLTGNADPTK